MDLKKVYIKKQSFSFCLQEIYIAASIHSCVHFLKLKNREKKTFENTFFKILLSHCNIVQTALENISIFTLGSRRT